jgi:hypothetical protein
MIKIAYILGFAALAANIFLIWYVKRNARAAKPSKPSEYKSGYQAALKDFLESDDGMQLKKSAAAELNVTVEELNRMPVEKITQLAKEMELI